MHDNVAGDGLLVVVEGIDGAGTTTQAGLLVEWLRSRSLSCALTAEPSRGPVGALLRQVLSGRVISRLPDGSTGPLDNGVISLLFAADRIDHLASEILPLLREGRIVVSDRYYHSSLTYQALEGEWEWIRAINAQARRPDITYLLDCPAETAGARLASSRQGRDIYEKMEVQRQLVDAYRRLPSLLPDENFRVVDATRPIAQVQDTIRRDLASRLAGGVDGEGR